MSDADPTADPGLGSGPRSRDDAHARGGQPLGWEGRHRPRPRVPP